MSKIDRMTTASDLLELTSTNQDLFMDLNQKDAEIISGGSEKFTIYNDTNIRIPYTVDGVLTNRPYGDSEWTAYKGGIVAFDYDFGLSGVQLREYDLADGHTYAFQYDTRTPYANDIELFDIT